MRKKIKIHSSKQSDRNKFQIQKNNKREYNAELLIKKIIQIILLLLIIKTKLHKIIKEINSYLKILKEIIQLTHILKNT